MARRSAASRRTGGSGTRDATAARRPCGAPSIAAATAGGERHGHGTKEKDDGVATARAPRPPGRAGRHNPACVRGGVAGDVRVGWRRAAGRRRLPRRGVRVPRHDAGLAAVRKPRVDPPARDRGAEDTRSPRPRGAARRGQRGAFGPGRKRGGAAREGGRGPRAAPGGRGPRGESAGAGGGRVEAAGGDGLPGAARPDLRGRPQGGRPRGDRRRAHPSLAGRDGGIPGVGLAGAGAVAGAGGRPAGREAGGGGATGRDQAGGEGRPGRRRGVKGRSQRAAAAPASGLPGRAAPNRSRRSARSSSGALCRWRWFQNRHA